MGCLEEYLRPQGSPGVTGMVHKDQGWKVLKGGGRVVVIEINSCKIAGEGQMQKPANRPTRIKSLNDS